MSVLRQWWRLIRYLPQVRELPARIALFQYRARISATRAHDEFSLISATRPADLALLLQLARGRRRVLEIGTGTGWTALSLALADRQRTVVSYDPVDRAERQLYLRLVDAQTRERVTFVPAPGAEGPRDAEPVDLLYVDSLHQRNETIREFEAWRPVLRDGALVLFDDFSHPGYPGVHEAVHELGLEGEQLGTLFVHRHHG